MTEIRTPRLLLRRWLPDDDLVPLSEIQADPAVMQRIGDGTPRSLDETAEDIERWEEEWDDEGFGIFAVELLGSGELAGAVGLYVPEAPPKIADHIGIQWRLARQFWGQGYASEAAQASLEYALQDRGIDRVVAAAAPDDASSMKLLHKLGMTATGEDEGLRLYAIDLSEYEG
ncbi:MULTISPECIES: GNAT family N-acetyltransferase [unclassified Streptomyces]|uniref:GNAT family N-acetyltransferase n=1 Tax=unclassified Streptomyces TaxID=2593676 RepID=UPI000DBA10A4|nr:MULTISPECIES: GNAT family N-acetyltransferase [unclassified Streptomyces]MYT70001.1 GNAT family N-acetyltransferase [Streptomyces sp. SID8367]RAJ88577.1 RimJ/RimL family protein N-acetyltransferase [Streptomyces sp. PsTaAH-137]